MKHDSQAPEERPSAERRAGRVFRDLRRLLSHRLAELAAGEPTADITGAKFSLGRSIESLEKHARMAEARELADRIAALAYRDYGEPLVLADQLETADSWEEPL